MAHLALALLGPFQATLDGQPVTALTSGRLRALLAYLAVESEREHSRAALASLLWPERPDPDALGALRFALSGLRRALGDRAAAAPFLLVSRHAVQFNRASDHSLDVSDFGFRILDASLPLGASFGLSCEQATLPEDRTLGADAQSQIENLKSAIALYRGEFLEGLAVGDSPAWEEWLLLRREQYHCQAVAALRRLAALHELRGEYELSAAAARRNLGLEPWDEAAHRRLMRVLALNGQRSAALAQYGTCRQVLAGELGVEPEDETTRLYVGIRDGNWVLPVRAFGGPRPGAEAACPPLRHDPAASFAFVARGPELERLDRFLALALAGRGQVVLAAGEAGSGKTALLAEFTQAAGAAHRDLVVAGGSGNEHLGRGDPYLPFREVLQQLTGDVEALRVGSATGGEQAQWAVHRLWSLLPVSVQALLAEGPDLIDRLLPGAALALRAETFALGGAAWRTRLEALLREQEARVPQAPAALHEQVTRVLLAITRRRPLLLLLDDLQWADAGSLSLLFHLGRRLAQGGGRLLVVCAYRPHDLAPGPDGAPHPLCTLARELQRTFGEIEVDLDRAAGRPFVDALLDAEPNALDEAFRASLYRATGGQALFTVELVRELRERGGLVRDETGRWVVGPALDRERLPARVEAVIAGRMDRLPAGQLALLSAASVEGETFCGEVLARASGRDEKQVLSELNGPLSRAHLVHARGLTYLEDGQPVSRYQFRHALFQAYLYRQLNAVERARLHAAVGAALETLHGKGAAEIAAQLAWHFEAAGLAGKAADYLLEAGRRAYLVSAPEEAIALYRRALALVETRTGGDGDVTGVPWVGHDRTRRELNLQLALYAALWSARDRGAPEQVAALERAHLLARRLGEPSCLLPVLDGLFRQSIARGQPEQALSLARQIRDLAEQTGEPAHLVAGHLLAGTSCFILGRLAPGREELEQALALYRCRPAAAAGPVSAGDGVLGADILAWLSLTLWLLGYPDQALARNREALALARELPHAPSVVQALTAAVTVFYALSRQVAGVQECAGWLERLVTDKKLDACRPWVEYYQGWLLVHGEEERAAAAGVARMQASMPFIQAVRPYRLMLLAEACLLAGQVDAGQQALDEALALVGQTGARSGEAEMYRLRGELLLKGEGANQQEKAEACFQRAIEVARQQEAKSWELRATVSLARLWAGQGRREAARDRLAAVYGWFTEGFDTPDLIEARALLAALGEKRQNLMALYSRERPKGVLVAPATSKT